MSCYLNILKTGVTNSCTLCYLDASKTSVTVKTNMNELKFSVALLVVYRNSHDVFLITILNTIDILKLTEKTLN